MYCTYLIYFRNLFLLLSKISAQFPARGIKKYLLCLDFAAHKSNALAEESLTAVFRPQKQVKQKAKVCYFKMFGQEIPCKLT